MTLPALPAPFAPLPDESPADFAARYRAHCETVPAPLELTSAERALVADLPASVPRDTAASVSRLLELYDLERARLTVIGDDMTEAGGGYDCAHMAQLDFDGGRLFVRRSNIRQAVDTLMAFEDARRSTPPSTPWWERVNASVAERHGARLDEPEGMNAWIGPVQESPATVAASLTGSELVKHLMEQVDLYRRVWRRADSQLARASHVLGVPRDEDLDDFLLAHHAAAFPPEFAENVRLRRARQDAAERAAEAAALAAAEQEHGEPAKSSPLAGNDINDDEGSTA